MNLPIKIEQLREQIEKARIAKIRAEADRDNAMAHIKELGFNTVKEAQKSLDDMQTEAEKLQAKIETGIKDIETKYSNLLGE